MKTKVDFQHGGPYISTAFSSLHQGCEEGHKSSPNYARDKLHVSTLKPTSQRELVLAVYYFALRKK